MTFLSCLSNLFVNSNKISKNKRFGGETLESPMESPEFEANRIPARCIAVIGSRFLIASRPNDKAKRFANSYIK